MPAQATEEARVFAVDSGTVVRVRPTSSNYMIGHLLERFTPAASSIFFCEATEQAPCTSSSAAGVRRIPMGDLRSVAIRGTLEGNLAGMGLYLGALAGIAADPDETGGGFVAGLVAGTFLGYQIGKRVTGWIPLFPCRPHAQCVWPGVVVQRR